MPECEITTSVFSAGANNPGNIPKGWLAEVADQLVSGKRYVGLDATAATTEPSLNTTRGHISSIIHNCANDCEVHGSMYSRMSDGKMKVRAHVVTPPPLDCECPITSPACTYACQIQFRMFGVLWCPESQNADVGLCAINWWNNRLVTLSNWTTNGTLEPCGWSKTSNINCAAAPDGILITTARVQFGHTNLQIVVNTGFASGTVFRRLSFSLPAGCHDMKDIYGIYSNQDTTCGAPAINGRGGSVEITASP